MSWSTSVATLGSRTHSAPSVPLMSSRSSSIGMMYEMRLMEQRARTWPQIRPSSLPTTQAPESPGTTQRVRWGGFLVRGGQIDR